MSRPPFWYVDWHDRLLSVQRYGPAARGGERRWWGDPLSYVLLAHSPWFRRWLRGHWVRRGWIWTQAPLCLRGETCERYAADGAQQSIYCWCPKCGIDLCSSVEPQVLGPLVEYRCAVCETTSRWNFDAGPCVLLLSCVVPS